MRATAVVLLFFAFCLSVFATQGIVNLNLHKDLNERRHQTHLFRNRQVGTILRTTGLILRRSSSFQLTAQTRLALQRQGELVVSIKYHEPAPKDVFNTRILNWPFTVVSRTTGSNHTHLLNITIPNNAGVGLYDVVVRVGTAPSAGTKFILLLNPWSRADAVFYPNQAELSEYVLNERGLIWVGAGAEFEARRWSYNQFEGINLETLISHLYRPSIGSAAAAADPLRLARHLSWVTAEHVCRGKWGTGSYTEGCEDGGYCCSKTEFFPRTTLPRMCYEPWVIKNVTRIFHQRLVSGKPVQYCQCFVFSAIINSLGRSLGFPTRAITNFNSAADKDDNGAIDRRYKMQNGFMVPADSDDSVWNFHVWNEVWTSRPAVNRMDISGWQVIDGTPQLESDDGKFEVGPASLKAVYANASSIPFETKFVIAEVNARINVWVWNEKKKDWVLKSSSANDPYDKENTIGKWISTMKPGPISPECLNPTTPAHRKCSAERLDLTAAYKPINVTRSFFKRGNIQGGIREKLVFPSNVMKGDSFDYGFEFHNRQSKSVTILIYYEVRGVEYNHEVLFKLPEVRETLTLQPDERKSFIKTITPEDYNKLFSGKRKREDQGYMEFLLSAKVKGSETFFLHDKNLFIHVP